MNKSILPVIKHKLKTLSVKRAWVGTRDTLNAFLNTGQEGKNIEWITVRQEEDATFSQYASAQLIRDITVSTRSTGLGTLYYFANDLYNAKKGSCIGDYPAHSVFRALGKSHWTRSTPILNNYPLNQNISCQKRASLLLAY
ncbi:hypothetical protein [Arachidicoccus sp.]|uniref:hypothetical protein n=1 Tax=Arachidicoccus sp. TaxID=1872624 RepID=UPI003D1E4E3F